VFSEDVYYLVVALMCLSLLVSIFLLRDTRQPVQREQDRVTGQIVEDQLSEHAQWTTVKWPSGKIMRVPLPLMAFVTGTFLDHR